MQNKYKFSSSKSIKYTVGNQQYLPLQHVASLQIYFWGWCKNQKVFWPTGLFALFWKQLDFLGPIFKHFGSIKNWWLTWGDFITFIFFHMFGAFDLARMSIVHPLGNLNIFCKMKLSMLFYTDVNVCYTINDISKFWPNCILAHHCSSSLQILLKFISNSVENSSLLCG